MLTLKTDIESIEAQSELEIAFLKLLPSIRDTDKNSIDRQDIVTKLEKLLDFIEDPKTVTELRSMLSIQLQVGGGGDRARELQVRMAEIKRRVQGPQGEEDL